MLLFLGLPLARRCWLQFRGPILLRCTPELDVPVPYNSGPSILRAAGKVSSQECKLSFGLLGDVINMSVPE